MDHDKSHAPVHTQSLDKTDGKPPNYSCHFPPSFCFLSLFVRIAHSRVSPPTHVVPEGKPAGVRAGGLGRRAGARRPPGLDGVAEVCRLARRPRDAPQPRTLAPGAISGAARASVFQQKSCFWRRVVVMRAFPPNFLGGGLYLVHHNHPQTTKFKFAIPKGHNLPFGFEVG